jgi:ABC-2 type transport system ATP-binding protein
MVSETGSTDEKNASRTSYVCATVNEALQPKERNPMNYAVEARALVKRYGSTTALNGIDLEVPTGTVTAVLGPNGAGKTTAVRILTTLSEADSGQAIVAGYDVRTQGHEVRRRIGLAAQDATVDPLLTGRENLVMLGELHQMRRSDAAARAAELLSNFSLAEAADRVTSGYSGGMRRRLDLAATLVAHPQVLFLDEPTTGLDPRGRSELWTVIDTLVGTGTTVVLTTQYLEEAERLADDIVVIDRGRIIARGDARKLKREVGGDQVQVVVVEPGHLTEATRIVTAVTGVEPKVDVASRSVTSPTSLGVETLVLVAQGLTKAQIPVDDLSLRQPTLDEVFLTLTGSPADDDETDQEYS